VGKHKDFLALVVKPGPPQNDSPLKCGNKKGAAMKFTTISKSLIMGMALLLASSAFAASKGQLELATAATINGTQLKAGEYKLEWDGSGPTVEVSVIKGKNVVAKTSAKLVNLDNSAANNAAVVMKNSDGTNTLTGIRFAGKKYALELGSSDSGMQSGSAQ
jgi:hypothetical protein